MMIKLPVKNKPHFTRLPSTSIVFFYDYLPNPSYIYSLYPSGQTLTNVLSDAITQ